MKFSDYLNQTKGKKYQDVIQEVCEFEDKKAFDEWAKNQRLPAYSGDDWVMIAMLVLNDKIKALEKKKDK